MLGSLIFIRNFFFTLHLIPLIIEEVVEKLRVVMFLTVQSVVTPTTERRHHMSIVIVDVVVDIIVNEWAIEGVSERGSEFVNK